MEMTPIDPRDNAVSWSDGATPHGRELSSTSQTKEETSTAVDPKDVDPKDVVKREVPVDQTAETVAAMLRRADPHLDAQSAARLAKLLLERTPPISTKQENETPAVGTTLDVSA